MYPVTFGLKVCSVSKQKYGVSLTNLKAQLADWFNDEKQKYFISREDLQDRARELARQLDIDQNAVDHGFIRLGLNFYPRPKLKYF